MRSVHRPPHPYLPDVSDRSTAIDFVARNRDERQNLAGTLSLPRHRATFASRRGDVLITYTPIDRSNMQTSDVVRV